MITDDIPVMRRYAHHGKRRRDYTDELFRCQFVDMISRTPLVCNHLLWKTKMPELREHLATHIPIDEVTKMSDSEVSDRFSDAKRIFLESIPEDEWDADEEETSYEDDFLDEDDEEFDNE